MLEAACEVKRRLATATVWLRMLGLLYFTAVRASMIFDNYYDERGRGLLTIRTRIPPRRLGSVGGRR